MSTDQNRRQQSSFFRAVFEVSECGNGGGGRSEVRGALAEESRGTSPEGKEANQGVFEGR